MSDQKKSQLNNPDDLADVKSLIGDAPASSQSVDDILTEFGKNRSRTPKTPLFSRSAASGSQSKIIAFPGSTSRPVPSADNEPDEPDPYEEEEDFPDEFEDDLEQTQESSNVIPFPEEESILTSFIKDLSRKAEDYADHMYEEDENTDLEEVRRLEQLIPGTDEEEPLPPPSRLNRPKKVIPPPPDIAPGDLARTYAKGLKGMRVRIILLFLLAVVSVVQISVPSLGLIWPQPLDSILIQHWFSVGILGAGMLLSADVLLRGIINLFHGKMGMECLFFFACVFTLADGTLLALAPQPSSRLPFSPVLLVGLLLLLHGTYHKRCALRLACRTAAASTSPYRVTLDEKKWNGRDTYAKWSGTAEGFGSQIQTDDGVERIFFRLCPLLFLGVLLCAALIFRKNPSLDLLIWGLSAMFTSVSAFGSTLAYGRPFHMVSRRLMKCGAALAGWPGLPRSRKADRVLITDSDLFPPGYIDLNGFKVLGNFPMERIVAYTATLLRDSGSGLTKLFHDYLRTMGGLMRNSEDLCCYEGGGLSATIRHDHVLVGSAAFMSLMEISIPQGVGVKNAVFCAINGELAGIFALNYVLPDTVFPALDSLIREKLGPVLATRDFNLIPAMLRQRFKLAADRMDFPPVQRRRELSDPNQEHSEVLTALLCREGLYPFAESIVCAKRLRRVARIGAALCAAASILGLMLSAYLVSVSAYNSLAPLNLLVYMFTWLCPVWLLTDWVHRF